MEELKLPQKIKDILDDFIQRLKSAYQEELVSVILYGSAARGEFIQRQSNVNLLIVLGDTDLPILNKISRVLNMQRFQILEPLFLTEDYIKSSLDVFPIEFLDIKDSYILLYGRDILEGMEIDRKNLRFQCEQEIKAKLLNIKNAYLRAKGRYALESLLFKSFTSIMHILRNIVRLKGEAPSHLKEDVLSDISEYFGIDIANFKKILEAKKNNLRLNQREIERMLSSFAGDVEKIVDIVDKG